MIVFDSSTLILLARAEFLDVFLDSYSGEVALPGAVEVECLASPLRPDGVLIRERIREGRILVYRVRGLATVRRLVKDFHLGRGEAEAIALALEKKAQLVATDDRNAIRACKLLRMGFTTAVGLLIRCTEKALLSQEQAKRCLNRLAAYGRYHPGIVKDALRRLGGGSHG